MNTVIVIFMVWLAVFSVVNRICVCCEKCGMYKAYKAYINNEETQKEG